MGMKKDRKEGKAKWMLEKDLFLPESFDSRELPTTGGDVIGVGHRSSGKKKKPKTF